MRLDEVGYHHRHDRDFRIDRPNGAGDWLLLLVKSPAFFLIEQELVRTPSNIFILYTPEYPELYYPDCDVYYDDWMHFGPDAAEEYLIQKLKIPTNQPVALGDISDLSQIMKNICFEQYSVNPNRKESVDLLFRLLLYKLNDKLSHRFQGTSTGNTIYEEKLLWIRESIYRWPGREYQMDELAEKLFLSRSRLAHLYAEAFGVSLKQDILTARIEKAKTLLTNTKASVKDIALIVGYLDVSYFTKLFRNKVGMTPNQFRQNSGSVSEFVEK